MNIDNIHKMYAPNIQDVLKKRRLRQWPHRRKGLNVYNTKVLVPTWQYKTTSRYTIHERRFTHTRFTIKIKLAMMPRARWHEENTIWKSRSTIKIWSKPKYISQLHACGCSCAWQWTVFVVRKTMCLYSLFCLLFGFRTCSGCVRVCSVFGVRCLGNVSLCPVFGSGVVSCSVFRHGDDISWWFIMNHWWGIIMIRHDDTLWWYIIMIINQDGIGWWYIMMMYLSWWYLIMICHNIHMLYASAALDMCPYCVRVCVRMWECLCWYLCSGDGMFCCTPVRAERLCVFRQRCSLPALFKSAQVNALAVVSPCWPVLLFESWHQ